MELCNDDYIITSLLRKSCYFHWLCDDSVVVLAATFVHLLIKAGMSIFTPTNRWHSPGSHTGHVARNFFTGPPRRQVIFHFPYWSTSAQVVRLAVVCPRRLKNSVRMLLARLLRFVHLLMSTSPLSMMSLIHTVYWLFYY
jgi:hypothetical protein